MLMTDPIIVTIRGRVPRRRMLPFFVAGRTEIEPSARTWHTDIIFSIDASAQQPFILRAVRFMAVGTGKNVVVSTITVRGYGNTDVTILMGPSMLISAVGPVNFFQIGPAFRAENVASIMAGP